MQSEFFFVIFKTKAERGSHVYGFLHESVKIDYDRWMNVR